MASGGHLEASRVALEDVSQYATGSMDCYYTADPTDDQAFAQSLADAAFHCHEDLRQRSGVTAGGGMATTLTLMLFVWPRAYLLQVGDSRYYILRDGELTQISRDQTLAQVLVDDDVFSRDRGVQIAAFRCALERDRWLGDDAGVSPASTRIGTTFTCCAATDSPSTYRMS